MSNYNKLCINDLLLEGRKILEREKIENPGLEAELLLGFVLNKSRMDILINRSQLVENLFAEKFRELLNRKLTHEPTAYILGQKEFFGRSFKVNKSVLIPRPETEELVEWIIKENKSAENILDICCGSGCIGISLACEIKIKTLFLSDISIEAVETAKSNINLLNGRSKVETIESNLFENIHFKQFDIIVVNPPYVTTDEFEFLDASVKIFEPRKALVVEYPGKFNRILSQGAFNHLKNGGRIYIESSPTIITSWPEILSAAGFKKIEIKRDLSGKERFVKAEKNN